MIGILGSILATLIQLAIIVGIVVFLVRRMSGQGRMGREDVGLFIRRLFVYSIMLGVLAIVGIGIAGLIDAAAATAARVTRDSAAVARSIAFVVVGVPIYAGLALYTARRLREDPQERRSFGWAFYLTLALVGSLITAMSLLTAFVGDLLDQRAIDRTLLINSVVWVAIWIGHWWIARREGFAPRLQIHLLLGSAAGLVAVTSGAGLGLAAALQEIYDRIFTVSVVDAGIEAIVRPLIVFGVGALVWWWYWLRHARRTERTMWWVAYVLLLGILGGVVSVLSGAGVALFGILQWFLGDPSSASSAVHFALLPGAAGAIAVGGAVWVYHSMVLGDAARRQRIELDRVYDYLLSGAGLLVAAGGLATLVAVLLDAIDGRAVTSQESSDAVAVAITLLVIGVPLWWRYWSAIRRYRETDPQSELHSVTRRSYLFLLFGATGVVAVVNLIVLVFITVEDVLDGTFGLNTITTGAVPVALLVTASALAWYHIAVFREDRAAAPDEERPTLQEIILVSADGERVAHSLHDEIGATVQLLGAVEGATVAGSVPDLLETLRGEEHRRIVIFADPEGGYDVIPLED